ncbi:hypothetical protein ACJJTC_013290 [Scirpophaga incertulas]
MCVLEIIGFRCCVGAGPEGSSPGGAGRMRCLPSIPAPSHPCHPSPSPRRLSRHVEEGNRWLVTSWVLGPADGKTAGEGRCSCRCTIPPGPPQPAPLPLRSPLPSSMPRSCAADCDCAPQCRSGREPSREPVSASQAPARCAALGLSLRRPARVA